MQSCFCEWSRSGLLERMTDRLRKLARAVSGRAKSPTAAVIDSQSAKTTESGGPRGCDAGKKILGRKRHVAVDVEGSPTARRVHPAGVQDRDGAPEVIMDMLRAAPDVRKLHADGACGGPTLEGPLEGMQGLVRA